MKIRIKGNSIRLRLTKTDIFNLREKGVVEEKTIINSTQIFEYCLIKKMDAQEISADFTENKITIALPLSEAAILTETDEITIKNTQDNGENGGLFLLIEKDLQCLDTTSEDQSDMYENPNSSCS